MQEAIALMTEWTGQLSGLLWKSPITLALLLITGFYLTVRIGLVQFSGFRHATELLGGKYSDPKHQGEVSHFQALSTALSATVGTGNIAGVGTAIALGGPGALFWMWVTAFFGMATKFTEVTLALHFREIDPDGKVAGGPMYTLLHGLKMRRLAAAFALFALLASFGIGNMVQANSTADGLFFIWPELKSDAWIIGVIMAVLVGLVIIGGVKRIAKFASTIVPFMAVFYVTAAIIVLFNHAADIPAAFRTILNSALNPWAVGGAAIGEAMRWGVARGLFSNEAGLGSSPMAHAAARTNEPVREGLVALLEPFIDTIIICTMTGLVIVVTGASGNAPEGMKGAQLTSFAFSEDLGSAGAVVVGLGLALFAFSTIVSWSYYGDRAARFLFGEQAVMPYRVVYTGLVVFGAAVPLELVWNFSDVMNILMAVPNLIALVLLAGLVRKVKDEYFAKHFAHKHAVQRRAQ